MGKHDFSHFSAAKLLLLFSRVWVSCPVIKTVFIYAPRCRCAASAATARKPRHNDHPAIMAPPPTVKRIMTQPIVSADSAP